MNLNPGSFFAGTAIKLVNWGLAIIVAKLSHIEES